MRKNQTQVSRYFAFRSARPVPGHRGRKAGKTGEFTHRNLNSLGKAYHFHVECAMSLEESELSAHAASIQSLLEELNGALYGQENLIELVVTGLLAGG